MMEAVKRGSDRQKVHEIIRRCSMRASDEMSSGGNCRLPEFLGAEKDLGLSEPELIELLDPAKYIGRCPEQVERFLSQISPLLSDAEKDSVEIEL